MSGGGGDTDPDDAGDMNTAGVASTAADGDASGDTPLSHVPAFLPDDADDDADGDNGSDSEGTLTTASLSSHLTLRCDLWPLPLLPLLWAVPDDDDDGNDGDGDDGDGDGA